MMKYTTYNDGHEDENGEASIIVISNRNGQGFEIHEDENGRLIVQARDRMEDVVVGVSSSFDEPVLVLEIKR